MTRSAFATRLANLAPLTEHDHALIDALDMRVKSFARRQIVIAQNDRPDYLYTVLSGWAARYEVRRDGARRISGFLLPGDFCGIHAVCHAAMDHAIVAITDVELGLISREAMGALAQRSQPVFEAVWRAKCVEEAILRKWLVYEADAQQAIGHLLCELYARAEAVGLVVGGHCPIPLTQEEIGDAMGITAVHTNRVIQKLRADDLIDLQQHELVIKDGERLRREAEFDPTYLQP